MSSAAVTVLDYGIGNLLNVVRALEHCGAAVQVVDSATAAPAQSDRMVLPGVGAFGDGMVELRSRGFDDLVRRHAQTGRPFLGICVGMQVMFETGEEMGEHAGIGLLGGRVKAISPVGVDGQPHPIPHIGWRSLEPAQPWQGTVFSGVQPGARVYFVHSFSAAPANRADALANTFYDGVKICAAVHRENLYGCQFHPERSGDIGLGVLKKFVQL